MRAAACINRVDFELFTCAYQPGELRLSTSACADQFRQARAKKPEPWSPLVTCRGCELGAMHAGVAISVVNAGQIQKELDGHCTRCYERAHRMLHARLCVSCYNRGREWIHRRNARGCIPVELPPLVAVEMAVVDITTRRLCRVTIAVASFREAAFSIAGRFERWGLIDSRSAVLLARPTSQVMTIADVGSVSLSNF